jgi:Cu/Zn superoxide dismutase
MWSRRRASLVVTGVALATVASACAELESAPSPPLAERDPDRPTRDRADPESIEMTRGVARLKPAAEELARGTVALTQTSDGVVVDARLFDLVPALHEVHVFAAGDCSARTLRQAADCRYRRLPVAPGAAPAGNLQDDEVSAQCLGALGTVEPDVDGVARLEAMVPAFTLERGSPRSLPGRVVIVRSATQPTHAVACGVVRSDSRRC